MECVGLIAMVIVNNKDYDVFEDKDGGLIYTPKERKTNKNNDNNNNKDKL